MSALDFLQKKLGHLQKNKQINKKSLRVKGRVAYGLIQN